MCTGMVFAMTFYNLLINGLLGQLSVTGILFQLALGLVIAFLLESFIVGPVAGRIVHSLPFIQSSKLLTIILMALCMVIGMVFFMSMYGVATAYYINGLGGQSFIAAFSTTALKNFVFALPLQLLIVGPIVRYLFSTFIHTPKVVESGSVRSYE